MCSETKKKYNESLKYLEHEKWKSLSCVQLFTTPLVHGILQAKILEWVPIPFSRGSSQPRDGAQASHTAGGFFTSWATREAELEKESTAKLTDAAKAVNAYIQKKEKTNELKKI